MGVVHNNTGVAAATLLSLSLAACANQSPRSSVDFPQDPISVAFSGDLDTLNQTGLRDSVEAGLRALAGRNYDLAYEKLRPAYRALRELELNPSTDFDVVNSAYRSVYIPYGRACFATGQYEEAEQVYRNADLGFSRPFDAIVSRVQLADAQFLALSDPHSVGAPEHHYEIATTEMAELVDGGLRLNGDQRKLVSYAQSMSALLESNGLPATEAISKLIALDRSMTDSETTSLTPINPKLAARFLAAMRMAEKATEHLEAGEKNAADHQYRGATTMFNYLLTRSDTVPGAALFREPALRAFAALGERFQQLELAAALREQLTELQLHRLDQHNTGYALWNGLELADLYERGSRPLLAEALYRRLVSGTKDTFGMKSEEHITALGALENFYYTSGQSDRSAETSQQIAQAFAARRQLAKELLADGQSSNAEGVLAASHRFANSHLRGDHPLVRITADEQEHFRR